MLYRSPHILQISLFKKKMFLKKKLSTIYLNGLGIDFIFFFVAYSVRNWEKRNDLIRHFLGGINDE